MTRHLIRDYGSTEKIYKKKFRVRQWQNTRTHPREGSVWCEAHSHDNAATATTTTTAASSRSRLGTWWFHATAEVVADFGVQRTNERGAARAGTHQIRVQRLTDA